MAPSNPSSAPRRQTTLIIGGSNGTAALCALLGDESNPRNANHVVRIATRSPSKFLQEEKLEDGRIVQKPRTWRCEEQKFMSDLFQFKFLPHHWVVHSGAPDSVFDYSLDDNNDSNLEGEYNELERAISGIGTTDNGGVADIILLCCPVSAHLPILRRIARALYKLDARGDLLSSSSNGKGSAASPILIGTLYAAGGFDWMSRIAFASVKPKSFDGVWKRKLALFGMRAFPYLVKSLEVGKVTLYGRYPQLLAALCPATPSNRMWAKIFLERALQCEDTGMHMDFVGLSSSLSHGGDGSAEWALKEGLMADGGSMMAKAAYVASEAAATGGGKKGASTRRGNAIGAVAAVTVPPPTQHTTHSLYPMQNLITKPMGDYADPYSALGFLSCTFNATNQTLHPAILVALFHDPANPSQSDKDGTIPWDYPATKKTPLPRFYADGAANPEAGRVLLAFGAEIYPLMDAMDALLSPAGMCTISSTHGGEPVGRFILEKVTNNHPRDLGLRTGLTEGVLRREHKLMFSGNDKDNQGLDVIKDESEGDLDKPTIRRFDYDGIFYRMLSTGLANNTRLGFVLSPAEPVKIDDNKNTTGKKVQYIKPKPHTRFFLDDIPNGLCLLLGLAEMLGFILERDMPETLAVVRRLQSWMGKEYVIPSPHQKYTVGGNYRSRKGEKWMKKVVQGARDLNETAAPQAFGINSVEELRQFLAMSPFAENTQLGMESNLNQSGFVSRL